MLQNTRQIRNRYGADVGNCRAGLHLCCKQAAGADHRKRTQGTSSEFRCDVCNESFDSAHSLQGHNSSARHKVNLLAQQLKSSGSFNANLQGLQVSEFE
jgi:hypothetical protein